MGTSFQLGTNRWHVAFGFATAAIPSGLLLGAAELLILGAAIVVSLALGRWISGLLRGMTSDSYGAVNEVAEVTVLLLGIALFSLIPGLYHAPFW